MKGGGNYKPVAGEKLKNLFEDEAKRAGHILGLEGELGFKHEVDNTYNFKLKAENAQDLLKTQKAKTEGNSAAVSMSYLLDGFKEYVPPAASEAWKEVRQAFVTARSNFFNNVDERSAKALAKIQKIPKNPPELVHLGNSGWGNENSPAGSHAIGITFYGEYMIVCNRGQFGDNKDCTKVYKIDPSRITHEQLKNLESHSADPNVTLNTIKAITGDKPPLATFPSKPQKFGNCSYANRMASVEAMLGLVKLQKEGKLNDRAIQEYARDPENRKAYKHFTKHCREMEVNRIITEMERVKDNPEMLAVYVNLALEIAKNRSQRMKTEQDPNKIQDEHARINKLKSAASKYYNLVENRITTSNKAFMEAPLSFDKGRAHEGLQVFHKAGFFPLHNLIVKDVDKVDIGAPSPFEQLINAKVAQNVVPEKVNPVHVDKKGSYTPQQLIDAKVGPNVKRNYNEDIKGGVKEDIKAQAQAQAEVKDNKMLGWFKKK